MNKEAMMLTQLIETFLDYQLRIRGYSPVTVRTYELALKQMAQKSFLYQEDAEWFLDITPFRFAISGQNPKTIAKKLSAVRSLVKYAKKQKHMTVTLIADATIKTPKTLPKPIAYEHIRQALDQSDATGALMIELLYGLGLRISELQTLRVEDIASQWVRVRGKGAKTRNIPLLPGTGEKIGHYLQKYAPKTYLFEKDGVKLSQNSIRYAIQKSFARIGVKATPHQLRHSYASHLLESGARIKDVSELLGHESLSATQIYTRLSKHKKLRSYQQAHPLSGANSEGKG